MRLSRIPLLVLSVSPAISLFRAYHAADARIKGLMSDTEAQRMLMINVAYAAVIYLIVLAICIWHLRRNAAIGGFRRTMWGIGMVLLPLLFLPTYLIFHWNSDSVKKG